MNARYFLMKKWPILPITFALYLSIIFPLRIFCRSFLFIWFLQSSIIFSFILSFELFYFCLICCISLSRLCIPLTFSFPCSLYTQFSIVDPYSIPTANQICLGATRTIKSNDHPSMDSKFRKVFQQRFQVAAVQKKVCPLPLNAIVFLFIRLIKKQKLIREVT